MDGIVCLPGNGRHRTEPGAKQCVVGGFERGLIEEKVSLDEISALNPNDRLDRLQSAVEEVAVQGDRIGNGVPVGGKQLVIPFLR